MSIMEHYGRQHLIRKHSLVSVWGQAANGRDSGTHNKSLNTEKDPETKNGGFHLMSYESNVS